MSSFQNLTGSTQEGPRGLLKNSDAFNLIRPQNAPHVLHVDEAEVNSVFDSQALIHKHTGSQANVQDLKVGLTDDRLHVFLLLDMHGKGMTIDLEGKLHSHDGYLQFEPLSRKVGALPIPRAMLAKVM